MLLGTMIMMTIMVMITMILVMVMRTQPKTSPVRARVKFDHVALIIIIHKICLICTKRMWLVMFIGYREYNNTTTTTKILYFWFSLLNITVFCFYIICCVCLVWIHKIHVCVCVISWRYCKRNDKRNANTHYLKYQNKYLSIYFCVYERL